MHLAGGVAGWRMRERWYISGIFSNSQSDDRVDGRRMVVKGWGLYLGSLKVTIIKHSQMC